MFSPGKLIIYEDSTFEYSKASTYTQYTKGKWSRDNNDKKTIVLNSFNQKEYSIYHNKLLDTVYLSLKKVTVLIKKREQLQMQGEVFR
jgi:hypothetical protein